MLAWVPSEHCVYVVFSLVVPATLSDEAFFDGLGWRSALYHKCTNAEQLLRLMKRLAGLDENTAPHAPENKEEKRASRESGEEEDEEDDEEDDDTWLEPDKNEYWYSVEQKLVRYVQERKWFTGKESDIKEETRLAQDNVKLLESLVTKRDVHSALAESVSESCSYHKKKLSKLEEELRQDRERLVGTSLDPENGSALRSLWAVCEQLQVALTAFEKEKSASPQPPSDVGGASPLSGSRVLQNESSSRLKEEETSFEAKLPWEE
ncbi:hypothetical protein STCU_05622 [Strigomonas culicis]|uniref:Uncharacterized protein n=1 Tax=Strigomonas culicis TaxID=28005 RepID=S9VW16_9TRYP|nr:hypothetical protein STCU_05622 [Strigomonas culicis]|eukprot:EPY27695.1 hypothetical protein STCU_05622 [Strigomonas culicis]